MDHDISCKTSFGLEPLRIRFDEGTGFIRVYDGIKYLVFGSVKYDAICNRIRYLISECNMLLHMFFLIIMQELKLIMIFYLQKKR